MYFNVLLHHFYEFSLILTLFDTFDILACSKIQERVFSQKKHLPPARPTVRPDSGRFPAGFRPDSGRFPAGFRPDSGGGVLITGPFGGGEGVLNTGPYMNTGSFLIRLISNSARF